MRILALDIGEKRIGVAVSDELKMMAHSLKVINVVNLDDSIEQIKELIDEYEVAELVVGMPFGENGYISQQCKKIEKFIEKLKAKIDKPIHIYDESYTSVESENILIDVDVSRKKRKKVIDKLAAQIILQSYLNNLKG